jgi:hypothetical protein
MLPLQCYENSQDNEGETGVFADMSMQPLSMPEFLP